jgi:hypothetical protein
MSKVEKTESEELKQLKRRKIADAKCSEHGIEYLKNIAKQLGVDFDSGMLLLRSKEMKRYDNSRYMIEYVIIKKAAIQYILSKLDAYRGVSEVKFNIKKDGSFQTFYDVYADRRLHVTATMTIHTTNYSIDQTIAINEFKREDDEFAKKNLLLWAGNILYKRCASHLVPALSLIYSTEEEAIVEDYNGVESENTYTPNTTEMLKSKQLKGQENEFTKTFALINSVPLVDKAKERMLSEHKDKDVRLEIEMAHTARVKQLSDEQRSKKD